MTRDLNIKEITEWILGNSEIIARVQKINEFANRRQAVRWLRDIVRQSGWRRAGLTEEQAGKLVDRVLRTS